MGFESLLGNQRLKENLRMSVGRGRVSHFYLISGPAGAGKRTLAKLLSAAVLCQGQEKPCGHCPACRKVLNNTHPDVITVDDPEKKTVSVELIRDARADMYIRPNEADKKIYWIPRAQDMGVPAQNALLKILEEPPAYGVFILLTDNPEKLLPTVRSRCTELSLHALPPEILSQQLRQRYPDAEEQTLRAAISRSGGYLGQALQIVESGEAATQQTREFAKVFGSRDAMGLLALLTPMEKWKRDAFLAEMEQWQQLLHSALTCRSGMEALSPMAAELASRRSSRELLQAIEQLKKVIEYAQGNVSVAAICGYLVWALR